MARFVFISSLLYYRLCSTLHQKCSESAHSYFRTLDRCLSNSTVSDRWWRHTESACQIVQFLWLLRSLTSIYLVHSFGSKLCSHIFFFFLIERKYISFKAMCGGAKALLHMWQWSSLAKPLVSFDLSDDALVSSDTDTSLNTTLRFSH